MVARRKRRQVRIMSARKMAFPCFGRCSPNISTYKTLIKYINKTALLCTLDIYTVQTFYKAARGVGPAFKKNPTEVISYPDRLDWVL